MVTSPPVRCSSPPLSRHMHTHECMHIHVHICTHAHTHLRRVHACARTHTHPCTCVHTRVLTRRLVPISRCTFIPRSSHHTALCFQTESSKLLSQVCGPRRAVALRPGGPQSALTASTQTHSPAQPGQASAAAPVQATLSVRRPGN